MQALLLASEKKSRDGAETWIIVTRGTTKPNDETKMRRTARTPTPPLCRVLLAST